MGLFLNEKKLGQPYLNGTQLNAYLNGKKLFLKQPITGPDDVAPVYPELTEEEEEAITNGTAAPEVAFGSSNTTTYSKNYYKDCYEQHVQNGIDNGNWGKYYTIPLGWMEGDVFHYAAGRWFNAYEWGLSAWCMDVTYKVPPVLKANVRYKCVIELIEGSWPKNRLPMISLFRPGEDASYLFFQPGSNYIEYVNEDTRIEKALLDWTKTGVAASGAIDSTEEEFSFSFYIREATESE